jgi:hypothetical protein
LDNSFGADAWNLTPDMPGRLFRLPKSADPFEQPNLRIRVSKTREVSLLGTMQKRKVNKNLTISIP